MKKYHFLMTPIVLFFTSCFVSMPVINNAFLANKSDSEKGDLIKIQNEIISINKEIKEIEKYLDITKQKYSVTKKKISLLEAQKPYLEEMVKLYVLMEESEKLGKSRSEAANNEEEIKFSNELFSFYDAGVAYQNARLESRHAELSVKIAEQELEKSFIISKANTGIKTDDGKDKKPQLKYKDIPCNALSRGVDADVCKIAEHFNDRGVNLSNKKKELDLALSKFQEAEKNIKKFNKSYEF